MGAVAASLAVMSGLHLSGTLGGGTRPFDPSGPGIAEAVICLVLGYGAIPLLRQRPGADAVALATTGFAIVGFVIGLGFTLGGGGLIDIAYHLSALPILLIALVALVRKGAGNPPPLPVTGKPNQGAGS
jgi:TctA family transporter